MFVLLQVAAIVAVGMYLFRWAARMHRRNTQSWESLEARLRPDWDARALTGSSFSEDGAIGLTSREKWKRLHSAHGLWAIYENTSVMLEMADYAARNSESFDQQLLATLRREAMQIRILVLTAFVEFAFSAVNETIWMNALRIESAYAEMALRITELLEVSAPDALPGFVAAI